MTKKSPKVSVIMAEYNTEVEYLKRAISSILNQTFTDFELVIIDDGGKNNLRQIIDEFNDKRIILYKNKKNMGLIYSLNKAISKAKGEYLVRMDTDDYSYPNRIKNQYDYIKKNPEYAVVGMRCDYYDGKKIYGTSIKVGEITRNDLLLGVPLIHPTVIMKKDIIKKVGGYQNFYRCEDYALWIELFSKGYKMYSIEDIGIKYTIRDVDYKKRGLKTRKGLFKLIRTNYKKLNPPFYITIYVYLKNLIAGIIPGEIMLKYHNKKYGGDINGKN